jgi:hypothetical protein
VFSPPVRWLLTAALAVAAIAVVSTVVSTLDGRGTVRARTCALAHAILCTAMIAMLWPLEADVPATLRVFILAGIATWFLALALRTRPRLASLHHAVTAAAMAWMTLDMQGGHHAMPAATPAGLPGVAAALGGYFLIAALPWVSTATGDHPPAHRRRGLHAAGNAAMSIGMAVLLIARP